MGLGHDTWVHFVEQVPPGNARRFDHVCGSGKTLLITESLGKYRAFCFRCAEGDSYERERTLAERVATLRALREVDDSLRVASLPPTPAEYSVDDWPNEAKLWFYRAGLSRADIGTLGAYYHRPSGRVVLPVTGSDGSSVWWQARAIEKGQVPKYLGPLDADRSRVCPVYGEGDSVLTEDILSAYKVGKAGAQGTCLMGTSLQPWVLAKLIRAGKPVAVWLDPDEAGQRAARRVLRELRTSGVSCRNIISERDPKRHTLQEIHQYVYGRSQ